MTRQRRVVAAAVSTAALVLGGCSASSTEDTKTSTPRQLTVAVAAQNFESLDPQMSASPPTDSVTRLMYEGLLALNKDGAIEPRLATEWKNPEPKVWEFTLRSGVTFHDGAPLDAEAVATSFNHIIDPKAKKTRASEFSRVEKVSASGPMTVRFDLKVVWPTLPNELAYSAGAVVSPKAIAAGLDLASHAAGTGPYAFKSLGDGAVTLTANTSYWGGAPKVETLKFVPVSAETTRVQMLKSGQADIVTALPISALSGLRSGGGTQVVSSPGGLVMHIGLNTQYAPLKDVRVRQAINLAVDRDAIIKTTLGGEALPADSYLAPTTSGYAKAEHYPYDVEKAKRLLADAGYPNGFDLTLTTPSGRYPMAAETAQAVQGYLSKVGIKVNIQTIDFGAEIDAVTKPLAENKVQSYLLGWQAATGEPGLVSDIVFKSSAVPPDGWNSMFYRNEEVDRALTEAATTVDEAQRNALYATAQRLVHQDAPWLFLYVPNNIVGAKKGLNGITTLPDGTLMLHGVS
ncbi:hypothetical protein Drose_13800 [Dactylosporangium roseum]|uniref:Solute-binding protein family 5 domain-containing protein n=1 Tax=Dactylosporangium roseum TaxID=47989 RepID=A0ABY5ZAT2_9ACTN|nr:ABC transporter substrate-binding protein [Dactylosporangium roseum]UWZ39205.1 hypothetical protein Drose_13800 [Dactylosporangium roseum]